MSSLVLVSGVARRSACEMASRSSLIRFVSVDATAAVQSMASAVKQRPVRRTGMTLTERAAVRAARKEQATKFMAEHQKTTTDGSSTGRAAHTNLAMSQYIWYLSVGIPAGLLVWGFNDENSPPAQFCHVTGITAFIRSYTDAIAKPAHNKLLPDWSQVSSNYTKPNNTLLL
jgi:hypothetical protein